MRKKTRIRVLLVEDNIVNARLAQTMLAQAEDQTFQVQTAETLLTALNQLASDSFDAALVDLNLPDCQGLDTFRAIQRHSPSIPIIILTALVDESAALKAVQEGAHDFLVKGSVDKEALIRALNYGIARSQKPAGATNQPEKQTRVLALLGSSGGAGTTTLACHSALELGQSGERVLLIDLDVSSSGASFLMKTTSQNSVLAAAENLHRLDEALWKGIICSPREGIDVLQAPGAVGIGTELPGERIRHVLRFARTLYGWVVVDLGRLNPPSLAVLQEAQDLFVVTTPTLPALFETGRLLQRLPETGFPRENVKLILNRKTKIMPVSIEELEQAMGYSFYACIADDSAAINEAYADGRFLDENLPLRKQVAELIRKWRGLNEAAPARSSTGFRRFARTLVGG